MCSVLHYKACCADGIANGSQITDGANTHVGLQYTTYCTGKTLGINRVVTKCECWYTVQSDRTYSVNYDGV